MSKFIKCKVDDNFEKGQCKKCPCCQQLTNIFNDYIYSCNFGCKPENCQLIIEEGCSIDEVSVYDVSLICSCYKHKLKLCDMCPLNKNNNGTSLNCDELIKENPELANKVILKWKKEKHKPLEPDDIEFTAK